MGISPGSPRLPPLTLKLQPRSQPSRALPVPRKRWTDQASEFENTASAKPSPFMSTNRKPLSRPSASTTDVPAGNPNDAFTQDLSSSDHVNTLLCVSLPTSNSQRPSLSKS